MLSINFYSPDCDQEIINFMLHYLGKNDDEIKAELSNCSYVIHTDEECYSINAMPEFLPASFVFHITPDGICDYIVISTHNTIAVKKLMAYYGVENFKLKNDWKILEDPENKTEVAIQFNHHICDFGHSIYYRKM